MKIDSYKNLLETQLEIAKRFSWTERSNFDKVDKLLDEVMRMLNKIIRELND
mgnify:CR=1 FL=1